MEYFFYINIFTMNLSFKMSKKFENHNDTIINIKINKRVIIIL
jgi:hypothetical protein